MYIKNTCTKKKKKVGPKPRPNAVTLTCLCRMQIIPKNAFNKTVLLKVIFLKSLIKQSSCTQEQHLFLPQNAHQSTMLEKGLVPNHKNSIPAKSFCSFTQVTAWTCLKYHSNPNHTVGCYPLFTEGEMRLIKVRRSGQGHATSLSDPKVLSCFNDQLFSDIKLCSGKNSTEVEKTKIKPQSSFSVSTSELGREQPLRGAGASISCPFPTVRIHHLNQDTISTR